MTTLILLIVVALLGYRMSTPENRRQAIQRASAYYARWRDFGARELAPFDEALGTRTPTLVVTRAIVIINVLCFVLLGATAGVSDGPRTTNGEWWRLVTALCTHRGVLLLLVNMAALLQLGRILERLLGGLAFLATFVVAGVFAEMTTLWFHPLATWMGASGAIYGLYGLLGVSFLAGRLHRSDVTIPPVAMKRVAPLAALFVLANAGDHFSVVSGDLVGLLVGIAMGVAIARDVSERTPEGRPLSMTLGGASIVAIAVAIPLRGIADVNPELHQLPAIEDHTKQAYDAVNAKYRKTQADARAVLQVIDATILPELHAADERIANLHHVPPEDEPRVAVARRYLQLRTESWTLIAQSLRDQARPAASAARGTDPATDTAFRARAQASHRSAAMIRGKAEAAERDALEALNAVKEAPTQQR